jgi:uncharacterized membrane protein YqiK
VVRSEQQVRISERTAASVAEVAKGEAAALRVRAEGEAHAVRMRAGAEAEATRKIGEAKADAYRAGVTSLGASAYTAMQLASVLAEHNMKLVPDVSVAANGIGSGLAEVLIARMLAGATNEGTPKA